MGPALLAAWAAAGSAVASAAGKIIEGAVGLWERVHGRGVKPAARPPVTLPRPPGRRRRWWGGPGGPTGTAPVVGLLAAILAAGCAGPMGGMSKSDLVDLCESVAPCQPCEELPDVCPPAGGEVVTPGPGPSPEPPPSGDGSGGPATPPQPPAPGDGLDLTKVVWAHRSPAAFPVTATLKSWRTDGKRHWVEYAYPKEWVPKGRVVGNLWVIARAKPGDDRWFGATFEWVLAGETAFDRELEYAEKAVPFLQAEASPVDKWRPRKGEEFYVLLTTITRQAVPAAWPVGRSNLVKVRWP